MLRGTKIPLEEKVHDIKLKADLHNRFDIEVVRGGEVVQRAVAHNVICNSFFAAPYGSSEWNRYIRYGSGSGTPSAADTQLFNEIGYKDGMENPADFPVNYDEENHALSFTRRIQILENEHVGATLTEVGTSSGTAASTLRTHAMLKDMNGNTISILKTATDIINIYATIYLTFQPSESIIIMPTAHFTGKEGTNSRTTQAKTLFQYLLGATPSDYLYIYASPGPAARFGGSSYYKSGSLTISVDSANKKLMSSTIRIPAASGNHNGLGAISLISATHLPAEIVFVTGKENSWYPGSNIVGEAIGTGDGTTTAFATAFPFVKSGAKIYVNGVEQTTGVTVIQDKPGGKNIAPYMNIRGYNLNKNLVTGPSAPYFAALENVTGTVFNVLGQTFFENPYYTEGIDEVTGYKFRLYCSDTYSDDITNYTLACEVSSYDSAIKTYTIPAAYKNKKFWALRNYNEEYGDTAYKPRGYLSEINCNAFDNFKNIVFDTPPAAGAVITADYTTALIAKDANHVFDFSFEISLGDGSL
jgi:hypothetical protein